MDTPKKPETHGVFTHFSRKGEEKEEGGQRKREGERTKNAETENQREAEGRLKEDGWVEGRTPG